MDSIGSRSSLTPEPGNTPRAFKKEQAEARRAATGIIIGSILVLAGFFLPWFYYSSSEHSYEERLSLFALAALSGSAHTYPDAPYGPWPYTLVYTAVFHPFVLWSFPLIAASTLLLALLVWVRFHRLLPWTAVAAGIGLLLTTPFTGAEIIPRGVSNRYLDFYPNFPPENFWVLWLVPILVIDITVVAVAVWKSWPSLHRLLLWSALIALFLLLLLMPILLKEVTAFGFWLTVIGFVIILACGLTFKKSMPAPISQSERRTLLARRNVLFGLAGLVILAGGVYYTQRYLRTRIPVYVHKPESDLFNRFNQTHVAWSPDSKRLAVSSSGKLSLRDAFHEEHQLQLGPATSNGSSTKMDIGKLAWSPDGASLACFDKNYAGIRVWETAHGKEIVSRAADPTRGVSWSPDSLHLISGLFPNEKSRLPFQAIEAWEMTTKKSTAIYRSPFEAQREDVAWSPDGNYVAAVGLTYGQMGRDQRQIAEVWNTQTGELVLSYLNPEDDYKSFPLTRSVTWAPDGKRLALTGMVPGGIEIWDVTSKKRLLMYRAYIPQTAGVTWSPNAKLLATTDHRATIVWDAGTGNILFTYAGHTANVTSVAWSPDGKYIASADNSGSVHIWQP